MKIFVITGPSGCGKSHLVNELCQKGVYPLEVYTDRLRRSSETTVTDRVYLTSTEFTNTLGEFLYWFEFQGNRYGYKLFDIETQSAQNKSICFNITPTDLIPLLKKLPHAITIYLSVDINNFDMLFERIIKRELSPTDTKENKDAKVAKIKNRLDYAKKELESFTKIQQELLQNPLSKVFTIIDDTTLYNEVLPYIIKLM